jgi:hypothetical protein
MRNIALILLLLALPVAQPAAQVLQGAERNGTPLVVVQRPGFTETAVASCAGGAAIGYLAVIATGAGSPAATAALFCGLSVAAGAASTVAIWTWREITGVFY